MEREKVVAILSAALDANRIELYLQPIVSLPQRKVRYYEALTRLRDESGELLLPADFLAIAEDAGLMPRIDNLLLFRCVQVVRRLIAKNREIGVFCNISGKTLLDPEFFPQLSEFMQANRALAPSLVLEFSQDAFREMGPMEYESLAALAELGFRFSLDQPRRLEARAARARRACFPFRQGPGKAVAQPRQPGRGHPPGRFLRPARADSAST